MSFEVTRRARRSLRGFWRTGVRGARADQSICRGRGLFEGRAFNLINYEGVGGVSYRSCRSLHHGRRPDDTVGGERIQLTVVWNFSVGLWDGITNGRGPVDFLSSLL